MELAGRNKGLHNNGDLGEGTLGTDGEARPPPARTSTSSSKFRELGITEDDDWIETVGRNMGRERNSTKNMRIAQHASDDDDEREGARKPWWTDLLCGCSRDFDDDEQVSLPLRCFTVFAIDARQDADPLPSAPLSSTRPVERTQWSSTCTKTLPSHNATQQSFLHPCAQIKLRITRLQPGGS